MWKRGPRTPNGHLVSGSQVQGQADQARIGGNTQRSQNDHSISTGPELVTLNAIISQLGEELSVSLRAAEKPNNEDAGAVDGEERTDTVELGGEDLEHDEGKGELGEGSPNVGAFEGSLGSAHLDNLIRSQHRRAGTVHSQAVSIGRPSLSELVS